MFETELFRKQMYCIEESTSDIFMTFRRPLNDLASWELRPPCYAPVSVHWSDNHIMK